MYKNCLIGIDLGATNVRVARIENKTIVQLVSEHIINSDNPDDLINQIKSLIKEVVDQKVEGIGIGVPSVVDVENGIVYDVQNIPSWKSVPLKSILEKEFGISVQVNNDANCFVLGEKYFGKGLNHDSIVGLILGTGFGAGLVLNGKLVSGENCGAGEVGMIPYSDSIYEHYCSGQFFESQKNTNGQEVFVQAREGSAEAIGMYHEFGTHLGNAIKTVMYAYDPSLIILGGSVSNAYQFFKEPMEESIKDFAYHESLKKNRNQSF